MVKALFSVAMFIISLFPVFGETAFEPKFEGQVLELRTYHAEPGKLDSLLARFRDHTVELFTKHGMTNVGYWVPVGNPDNLLIYLMAYPDKEARDASWKAFMADPDWKKAYAESTANGKLVGKVDQLFMTPTDFSEGFAPIAPVKPKGLYDPAEYHPAPAGNEHLIEMRTYTTTPGHLPNLHARFRDHTMALFKNHGMTNLAYFQLTPDQPGAENTLLYFLAHKDAAAAAKSWDAFRIDPEWVVAKRASEKKAGESLTADKGVKSVFLKPTDFSPVK
jgi:hypothetical protein